MVTLGESDEWVNMDIPTNYVRALADSMILGQSSDVLD